MDYNYDYKFSFGSQPFDINLAMKYCSYYAGKKLLFEVQNTKYLKSSDILLLPANVAFRVAGAYDDKRVENRKNMIFKNGETGEYYKTAVIYSKNEMFHILKQLESLESGINKDWSNIQKVIYVYDKLRNGIMYDPKFEHKYSNEIRSLRGLISRETVCAGYSLIFKECMDRLGIKCDYVEGYVHDNRTGGHAWNLIHMDGKIYPIDLTWDNTKYRSGHYNTFDWFTKNASEFAYKHKPINDEEIQDYEHTLSTFDPNVINRIYDQLGIGRNKLYYNNTYTFQRKDGTSFILSQLGNCMINGKEYFRYYFAEKGENGLFAPPEILFSGSNISKLIDAKNFNRKIPDGYEDALYNILFTYENIIDSLQKGTRYIGEVNQSNDPSAPKIIKSVGDINKSQKISEMLSYDTRRSSRSDGSKFVIQQMWTKPRSINGIDLYRYDIFELVTLRDGKRVPKKTSVYTEMDLFKDHRIEIKDILLSRDRLDRKVNESGGYIGYLDSNNIPTYHEELRKFILLK